MTNDRKIAFSSKLSFGVGQMAEGLKNFAFGVFVLFYYSQVLDVPASVCGTALFVALAFDAITDPLAGSLSDHWKSPRGRRHPFMYAAAVPLGLAFWGLFSPPVLSTTGLAVWLLVFAILTRAAMTLYHVPHLALGAELTESFEERTSIVAFRQAFGYLGALTAAGVGFGWFFSDAMGGRTNAASYPPFALVLAVAMIATIWLSAWGTRKEIPFLPKPDDDDPVGDALGRLLRDFSAAFENRSFRWLFAGVLIVFVMVGVDNGLNLYINQYFWGLADTQLFLMAAAPLFGMVLGTPLVRPLHHFFDKRAGLLVGTAGWATLQILPIALRLADWIPDNGSPALLPTLLAFKFAQGLIVQQALVSFGSMMADVADEHELASGRRTEGIFFGAISFSGKMSSGLGTFLAGVGLDVIAFPRGAEISSSADVAPETLVQLGILVGPILAGFGIVSVWCYTHYHLNRARHAAIISELAKVRGARKPAPGPLAPEPVLLEADPVSDG